MPGTMLSHDLHLHLPLRKVASLDRSKQIFLRRFASASDDFGSLGIGPVLVALLGLEVKLHPHALAGGVDQAVRVRAIAVDVTHAGRQPAV